MRALRKILFAIVALFGCVDTPPAVTGSDSAYILSSKSEEQGKLVSRIEISNSVIKGTASKLKQGDPENANTLERNSDSITLATGDLRESIGVVASQAPNVKAMEKRIAEYDVSLQKAKTDSVKHLLAFFVAFGYAGGLAIAAGVIVILFLKNLSLGFGLISAGAVAIGVSISVHTNLELIGTVGTYGILGALGFPVFLLVKSALNGLHEKKATVAAVGALTPEKQAELVEALPKAQAKIVTKAIDLAGSTSPAISSQAPPAPPPN